MNNIESFSTVEADRIICGTKKKRRGGGPKKQNQEHIFLVARAASHQGGRQ